MNLGKVRKVCKTIASLTEESRRILVPDLASRDYFRCCLVAAFAKNLEFNLHSQSSRRRDAAFFWMGSLRGMCEDYIVLKFLLRLDTVGRMEVTRALFGRALGQSMRAQVGFFETYRPYQFVLKQPVDQLDTFLANMKAELKRLGQHHGWGNTAFPSVQQMAAVIGESDLYTYLYHATSSLVHFNPKVLLEMGWGPLPGHLSFSVRHFSNYYRQFSLFYGALLLMKCGETFGQELGFSDAATGAFAELRVLLEEPGRWPELVTFEAMNVEPATMDRVHHIVAAMIKEEEQRSQPHKA
jgi:hypothetical protein